MKGVVAMTVIETWFNQEIDEAVKVRTLCGDVFNQDSGGNLIGVRMYRNGFPVNLSGNCAGYCILANGATVPVVGAVSGNTAYIILPAAAYTVPGPINILIKLTDGTTVTTIAAVTSTVFSMGDPTVADPSQATIDAWSAQISATLAAIQNSSVLYSQSQSLSTAQKSQARSNIGANASVRLISGDDYKITIP
jgi:hypothetical protein